MNSSTSRSATTVRSSGTWYGVTFPTAGARRVERLTRRVPRQPAPPSRVRQTQPWMDSLTQPVTIAGGLRVGDNGPVTTSPDPDAEWWTTTDVAAYLGVQVGTVSTYRKRGQMPAPDLTVGRTHMWRPVRIIDWHGSRPRPGVGGRAGSSRGDGHTEQQAPEG
jgi:hypothetical protein